MSDIFSQSPPLFTLGDFPSLRRVKPLPKRRRTSEEVSHDGFPDGRYPDQTLALLANDMASFPLPPYYYPIFTGTYSPPRGGETGAWNVPILGAVDLHSAYRPSAVSGPGSDDDEHNDGDFPDHAQNPGNTKKRKVPAAHNFGPSVSDGPNGVVGVNDDTLETGSLDGAASRADPPFVDTQAASAPLPVVKSRTSNATLAGMKHKEVLKARKKQLGALLGTISQGDSLALDQALSSHLPWFPVSGVKRRPAWRKRSRRFGRLEGLNAALPAVTLPQCDFTFKFRSPTTDRLEETKKEVAVLHSRFEAELARQSAKAAEMAEQVMNGGRVDANATDRDRKDKNPKGRKKKAHHYVRGTRIRAPAPTLTPEQVALASQNSLGPPPIRFLMAELRGSTAVAPPIPPTQLPPQLEEWICPFCEYDLFYGLESSFRRAVRSRKKVLGRRRRAKERAAAAASGASAPAAAPVGESVPVVESVTESSPAKSAPPSTTRRERDKSRGAGDM